MGFCTQKALETLGLPGDGHEQLMGITEATASGKLAGFTLPHELKGDKKYEKGYSKKVLRRGEDEDDVTIVDAERWAIEKMVSEHGGTSTDTAHGGPPPYHPHHL